jgi:hypothetical protein
MTKIADLSEEEFKKLLNDALRNHVCQYDIDPNIVHQIAYEVRTIGQGCEEKGLEIWVENHKALYKMRLWWDKTTNWVGRAVVTAIVAIVLTIVALGYRELTK